MKFKIEELTNPLTADVLNRKDFAFTSSGGGGGGGGTVLAIKPVGDILSDGVSVTAPAVGGGGSAVLATVNINLIGGRKLFAIATIGALNYAPAGPTATSTLQIWVGGVKISEIVNPAGNLTSIITFQGIQAVTAAGLIGVEVKIVNGPLALGPINATITVMEFVEL